MTRVTWGGVAPGINILSHHSRNFIFFFLLLLFTFFFSFRRPRFFSFVECSADRKSRSFRPFNFRLVSPHSVLLVISSLPLLLLRRLSSAISFDSRGNHWTNVYTQQPLLAEISKICKWSFIIHPELAGKTPSRKGSASLRYLPPSVCCWLWEMLLAARDDWGPTLRLSWLGDGATRSYMTPWVSPVKWRTYFHLAIVINIFYASPPLGYWRWGKACEFLQREATSNVRPSNSTFTSKDFSCHAQRFLCVKYYRREVKDDWAANTEGDRDENNLPLPWMVDSCACDSFISVTCLAVLSVDCTSANSILIKIHLINGLLIVTSAFPRNRPFGWLGRFYFSAFFVLSPFIFVHNTCR